MQWRRKFQCCEKPRAAEDMFPSQGSCHPVVLSWHLYRFLGPHLPDELVRVGDCDYLTVYPGLSSKVTGLRKDSALHLAPLPADRTGAPKELVLLSSMSWF